MFTKLSAARNSDYALMLPAVQRNPAKKVKKVRQINEEGSLRCDDDDDDDDNHFCDKADCSWKDGDDDEDDCG